MTETDELLKKLGLQKEPTKPQTTEEEDDEVLLPCYAFLRGRSEKPTTLNLKFKNGKEHALSYAWFHSAELDPSMGITMNFTETLVRLEGTNLGEIYKLLLRFRITSVQEVNAVRTLQPSDVLVTNITLRKPA